MTHYDRGARTAALRGTRAQSASLSIRAAAIVTLVASSSPGVAQHWSMGSGVSVRGEVTNNVNFAPAGQEESSAFVEVSPSIWLTREGGRLRLTASGSLGARVELRGSESNTFSLHPQGSLDASWEAIERFFFVDAGVNVQQTIDNPFLARPSGLSTYNTSTSYQAYLSPYIQGNLGAGFAYTVRSDNRWTDSSSEGGQYGGRNSASIERAPQPLGGSLYVEHWEASSPDEQPNRTSDLGRAVLRYAPVPDLAVGLRAGSERNNYVLANKGQWQSFYGVDMTWRPTERTSFDGYWEDRYFGSSWNATFSHRMPRLAVNVQSSRGVVTASEQFLTFPGLANLLALLDASLTTRVPDPIERRRIIVDFLSRQQLPPELLTPVVIFNDRMSVETRSSASAVLLGVRHSLALSIYRTETVGLPGVANQPSSTLDDNIQLGMNLAFSHNLTPTDTMTASASWTRTDIVSGQTTARGTTQKEIDLLVSTKLGAWTNGYVGGRYKWIDSVVTNDSREAAVFAGFDYRFN